MIDEYQMILDSEQFNQISEIICQVKENGYWVGRFIGDIENELFEYGFNVAAINLIEVQLSNSTPVIIDLYFVSDKKFKVLK